MSAADEKRDMDAKAVVVDADTKKIDQAALFLAEAEGYVPFTPKQEQRLKRKIDFIVVPMVILIALSSKSITSLTRYSCFLPQLLEPSTRLH